MTPPSLLPLARQRWPIIDALRGVAIVSMVAFHATWDLYFFGFSNLDVTQDPRGRWIAHLIAGTFLTLVGIGLVLSVRGGFDARAFLIRLAKIAGGAAIVSIGTFYAMPEEWIFFGILHAIALFSLLALPLIFAPLAVLYAVAFGFALVLVFASHISIDAPWLLWLGLSQHIPRTNDYVPLVPWFGVVIAGVYIGRLALMSARVRAFCSKPLPRNAKPLQVLGRWSLVIYLVHQPILFGAFYGLAALQGDVAGDRRAKQDFTAVCVASCRNTTDAALCEKTCACIADQIGPDLSGLESMGKDAALGRIRGASAACQAAPNAP